MCDVLIEKLKLGEWTKALRKLQHDGYNKLYYRKNRWFRKLSTMTNTWRKYYYQFEGSRDKKLVIKKRQLSMGSRLACCLKIWGDNRRRNSWAKKFENIRTNWRDRGKRIYGKR